ERTDLSPSVRGSIVHRVLERLVTESLADGSTPRTGEAWTTEHRDRAAVLLSEECSHAEARGEAAHPRFWPTIRSRLAAELDDFLVLDSSFRARFGSRPITAEHRFGGGDALMVTLADGRVLRFRGSVDRVDEVADGGLVVVDAKTGKPDRYRTIPEDHFPDGSFLQLPIYALAVAAKDREVTHATYAFVGGVPESHRHLGYDVDDEVMAAFRRVLASVVRGIEGGAFPHHPPESDRPEAHRCPHCSPDGLDARRVRAARDRKAGDPVLALHADHLVTDFMAEPTDEDPTIVLEVDADDRPEGDR
ncbi:MAG: PD-(D/E)XK nuclease family protein, partial [Actinomycetota bacterium]|nr:PD-(D/E)XK nuclease family protein [Actinomycetota bacterium]